MEGNRYLKFAGRRQCLHFVAVLLFAGTAVSQESDAGKMSLSADEQRWLAAHPILRYSADPLWPPFSLKKDGALEGVDVDYLKIIADRLGVRLEYVPTESWAETKTLLESGKIDFSSGVARVEGRDLSVLYTEPYTSFPVAVIMRADGPFFTSLAQVRRDQLLMVGPSDYAPTLYLQKNHPGMQMVFAKTSLEALQMVAAGKADAVAENLGVASHLIKTHGLANLKIAGLTDERFDLRIGVREDLPELHALLDKAMATISEDERLRIYDKWMLVDLGRTTDWGLITRLGLLALLFAGSIIGVIVVWNRRLARELARRKQAEASLIQSESTFRNLFETMQDAYFLTRMGGEIQLVNAEAVRMLQLGSRRFIERLNIATFFEQPGERDRVMEQLAVKGNLRDYPLEFARADGSLCACLCNIQILKDTTAEQIAIEYIARWHEDPASTDTVPVKLADAK